MSLLINRRNFFGNSLVVSSGLIAGGAYSAALQIPKETDRVLALLQKQLKLGQNHTEVVAAFTDSLLTKPKHSQSADAFRSLMNDGSAQSELEAYVVQEFVVSTNYLAYAAAEAGTLVLLP